MKKHINKYENKSFNGYRVAIQKKGLTFVKYFSSTKLGDENAKNMAIAYEAELVHAINACSTIEELVELRGTF